MEESNQVNNNFIFNLRANQQVHNHEQAHSLFEDEESDYYMNFLSNPYIFNQENSIKHDDNDQVLCLINGVSFLPLNYSFNQ